MIQLPESGEIVEAFDAWRVRQFLGGSEQRPTVNELEDACADLVSAGELTVVRPGWFRAAERQVDGRDS